MDEKIKVISTVEHRVVVLLPELSLKRVFSGKGYAVNFTKQQLEEAMYNTGFRRLVEEGVLWIEDMSVKKDLGLEPEEATAPTNIVLLSDEDMKKYMTSLSLKTFKEKVNKMSSSQRDALCDYAIANRLTDFDKCAVLLKATGRDILRTLQLKEEA